MDRIVISDSNTGALYIRALEPADDQSHLATMLWRGVKDSDLSNFEFTYWLSKVNYASQDGCVVVLVKEAPTSAGPVPNVVGVAVALNNPRQNALELFGAASYWDAEQTTPLLVAALRGVAAASDRTLVKRVIRVTYEVV